MLSKSWQVFGVLGLVLLAAAPSLAGYGFGNPNYEEDFENFYSAKRLLMKCYPNGTEDGWLSYTADIYNECINNGKAEERGLMLEERNGGRRVFFNRQRLKNLYAELESNIAVLQCVFDRLELHVGRDGKVLVKPLKNYVNSCHMPESLQKTLLHEVDRCTLDSACGEFNLLGRQHANLLKLVKFYECWQTARLRACISYDIDTYKSDFDLKSLGSYLSDLDDSTKRMRLASAYYNDMDKMGGLWTL